MKKYEYVTIRLDARFHRQLLQHADDFQVSPTYMAIRLLEIAIVRCRALLNTLESSSSRH